MSKEYTYKVEKKADNEVDVLVSLTPEAYKNFEERVFVELAPTVKVAGFRAGKAPRAKVEAALGTKLFNETIRQLLPEFAAAVVEEENLNPVTQLEYEITGVKPEGGLEYKFSFVSYPEVKLGNLEKLNIKLPEAVPEVTEEEVNDLVKRLFANDDMGEVETGEEADKEKTEKKALTIQDISDEMAAGLNLPGISSQADLKNQIEERLRATKITNQERELENQVVEAAVKASTIVVPPRLIHERAHELVHEYEHQLQDLGINFDDFLKAQSLDHDKLLEQKKGEAEQRVQVELLLNEIARTYELTPTNDDIEAELKSITDSATRTRMETSNGRRYILVTLLQQRALDKLLELARGTKSDKKAAKAAA